MIQDLFQSFDELKESIEEHFKNFESGQESILERNLVDLKYYIDRLYTLLTKASPDCTGDLWDRFRCARRSFEILQRQFLIQQRQKQTNCCTEISSQVDDALPNLRQSNIVLQNALILAANSEQLSSTVFQSLYTQRNTIKNSLKNLTSVKDSLNQSESIVHRLSQWWRNILWYVPHDVMRGNLLAALYYRRPFYMEHHALGYHDSLVYFSSNKSVVLTGVELNNEGVISTSSSFDVHFYLSPIRYLDVEQRPNSVNVIATKLVLGASGESYSIRNVEWWCVLLIGVTTITDALNFYSGQMQPS